MSNDLRKRISIQTPEGVSFSLYLAGPYTRFLAWLLDAMIIGAVSMMVATIANYFTPLVWS
jgi:uncharacterized RDD family membrane protein YckC